MAGKSLEEFDFDHQRSLKRETITRLGTLDFFTAEENVHRVAFAIAAGWVGQPARGHHAGRLQDELVKLGRIPLLIVDEIGGLDGELRSPSFPPSPAIVCSTRLWPPTRHGHHQTPPGSRRHQPAR